MIPTLLPGSHVFARKDDREAVRGGVYVFRNPEHPEEVFVQRAIALPGETIEVKYGRVFIDGWEAPRCKVGRWKYTSSFEDSRHDATMWVEYLGDYAFLVVHEPKAPAAVQQGPFKVAAGAYFTMGDNRENSFDARMWNGREGGAVPFANTVGRVRAVDPPRLPPGAGAELQAAFDACRAKWPAKTSP